MSEVEVRIPIDPESSDQLTGDLVVPDGAGAIVVFAHGSGSSRKSSRNRMVAEALQREGLATLLFDLLTPAEEQVDLRTRELRFDIDLLAERLMAATAWLAGDDRTRELAPAYFGASTGAAAALVAAARIPNWNGPIVSRGGRPDLAGEALGDVTSPVLLIIGEADHEVLELNRKAADALPGDVELEIVPRATHLFEEPGELEAVAQLAGDFLSRHLAQVG